MALQMQYMGFENEWKTHNIIITIIKINYIFNDFHDYSI